MGKNVVVPYLLDRGIKTLDYVLISHFDSDHCNGLIAVLENLKIGVVIFAKPTQDVEEYENVMRVIKERNIKIQLVQKGDRIVLDKYTYLDILYPDFKIAEKDLNNNAIVAKLNYGNFSMLFTGDIEKPAEQHIVGNDALVVPLQSTILKTPHHRVKNLFNRGIFESSKTQNSSYRSRSKQHIRTSCSRGNRKARKFTE